jgi:hypothetical protein
VLRTWRTLADCDVWHSSDAFVETRQIMDKAEQSEQRAPRWYEVVAREAA